MLIIVWIRLIEYNPDAVQFPDAKQSVQAGWNRNMEFSTSLWPKSGRNCAQTDES